MEDRGCTQLSFTSDWPRPHPMTLHDTGST